MNYTTHNVHATGKVNYEDKKHESLLLKPKCLVVCGAKTRDTPKKDRDREKREKKNHFMIRTSEEKGEGGVLKELHV